MSNLVSFGSICNLQNGRAFKPSEWSDNGTPIIRIQNLNDETKPFNYCDFEVEERFHVNSGDLLFSWSGTPGTSFGAFFWNRGRGFLNQHIFRVDIDEKNVSKDYLRYALNSKLNEIMDQAHGGVGLQHITKGKLEAVKIPLPPIGEQKRIATILDKADSIRRKRHEAISMADEFLKSVFLDMFGDPVTNPKGWEVKKLGELCGVGSSSRVFVNEFVQKGVPFYRGTEVGKLGAGETVDPHLFIADDHYKSLSEQSGVPKVGDLLLPSICHDGRIWVVNHENPFYFKDGRVLWIKVDGALIISEYLRNYLKNIFLNNYSAIASGTTFAELKIVNLKELKIFFPPIELQKKFSSIIEKTKLQIGLCCQSHKEADGLFLSLSQKAFAGQL